MSRVWIVPEHNGERLTRPGREALVAGQRLAADLGVKAEVLLLGADVSAVANHLAASADLAGVHTAQHEALAVYTPGAYCDALAPAIEAASPAFVVFAHNYQTVDYFARLAQRLGAGLLPEVTAWEQDGEGFLWSRPILAGKMTSKVRMRGTGTVLLSVQSGAFSGDALAAGSAPVEALALGEVTADREILSIEDAGGNEVDLTKADVIIAVGRGVGGEDKLGPIHELAEVLGADIGASRPVIDSGWLPRDRQIGSSGQTVSPKLYIAVGISGAIQHAVGMKGSSCVVAINKDSGAPIFGMSQYGIVGDLHEVLPALTAAIRESREG
ncbi:MAG: electron transfer flavoprotein subunit alpha/FixB family protein [Acidobacteriota bacterium]